MTVGPAAATMNIAESLDWLDQRQMFAIKLGLETTRSLLDELEALQRTVLAVHASDALLAYVQDLIAATRSGRWFVQGLSPRAGIALVRAAKARALIEGRDYVAPDDVQAVLPQTIAHRLVPVGDAGRGALEQVRAMVEATPLP